MITLLQGRVAVLQQWKGEREEGATLLRSLLILSGQPAHN